MNQQTAQKPQRTVDQVFKEAVQKHHAGEHEDAERLYRICLVHQPRSVTAWTNLGALMRAQKKLGPAIACHRRALELDAKSVNARSNLANALADIGDAEQSADIREELLREFPDEWSRIRDLAIAYRGCWRNQEAVDLIDEAEARLGADEQASLQRSLANLMLGNWKRGFADFEARYSGDEVALPQDAPWSRWMGEDLKGTSIVVLPEQGFGDAILMSRFLPGLKALGAEHVSMVVKKPLFRLLGNAEGMDKALTGARRQDHFDYYTPNMSLPHLVGMPDDGTPPPLPRLTIPDDSRVRARKVTAAFKDRFKIGIVWTGSLTYRANHRRSTTPENFLNLAMVPGVQLFSLYKGDAHGDFISSGMASVIVDSCGHDRDFADTAALIDEMDLMITTDTAVVHVAASLGKPVWNMLTWEGFWLYGDREKTPWYPSMRLFRQSSSGNWNGVLEEVESQLRNLLVERRA